MDLEIGAGLAKASQKAQEGHLVFCPAVDVDRFSIGLDRLEKTSVELLGDRSRVAADADRDGQSCAATNRLTATRPVARSTSTSATSAQ